MAYNNKNLPSINTSLLRSTSDACIFSVKAWDKQISVSFAPCLGTNADGIRNYETEFSKIYNTALRYENAMTLAKKYHEVLEPAIAEGTPCTISVETRGNDSSSVKVFTIGYDGTNAFARLAWNIDDEGKGRAEDSITHTFNKRVCKKNYNILDGTYEEEPVEAELAHFIDNLEAVKFTEAAINHGIRYDNAIRAAFANNRYAGRNAAYGGANNYNQNQNGNGYGYNHQGGNNYNGGYNAGNAFMPTNGGDEEFLPFQ